MQNAIAAQDFLHRILSYYAGSFDITEPYTLAGRQYAALAALHAHEDQYVRLLGTQLWQADSHEYTLFSTFVGGAPTVADVQAMAQALAGPMEETFVRAGQPLPPPQHQYTWLTGVLICEKAPDEAAVQALRRVKHTRYYRFYLRGYSESRLLLVDLQNRRLYTNRAGKGLQKLYKLAFQHIAKAEAAQAKPD